MNKYKILIVVFVTFGSLLLVKSQQVQAQEGQGMTQLPQDFDGQVGTGGDGEFDHGQDLDQILGQLLDKYQTEKIQDLPCNKITDDDFEDLGDAFMESIHPGQAHESMDRMMGGEGSASLRQAHIHMGQNYLGCNSIGAGGMMGRGMMGTGMMSGWNKMMNSSSYFGGRGRSGLYGLPSILINITYLLIIVLLIVGIRYLWIRGGEKKK